MYLGRAFFLLSPAGSQAVALFGEVAGMVAGAMSNKDNLGRLMERVADLMDLILDKHASKEEGGQYVAQGEAYGRMMTRLQDLLMVGA